MSDKPAPQPCQANTTDYLTWHAKADRLTRRGVRQRFCTVCERWQFPGEECVGFVTQMSGTKTTTTR